MTSKGDTLSILSKLIVASHWPMGRRAIKYRYIKNENINENNGFKYKSIKNHTLLQSLDKNAYV